MFGININEVVCSLQSSQVHTLADARFLGKVQGPHPEFLIYFSDIFVVMYRDLLFVLSVNKPYCSQIHCQYMSDMHFLGDCLSTSIGCCVSVNALNIGDDALDD